MGLRNIFRILRNTFVVPLYSAKSKMADGEKIRKVVELIVKEEKLARNTEEAMKAFRQKMLREAFAASLDSLRRSK